MLVVIGILIALSINNWNQNRINKNDEYKYLAEIRKEILRIIVGLIGTFLTDCRVKSKDYYPQNNTVRVKLMSKTLLTF